MEKITNSKSSCILTSRGWVTFGFFILTSFGLTNSIIAQGQEEVKRIKVLRKEINQLTTEIGKLKVDNARNRKSIDKKNAELESKQESLDKCVSILRIPSVFIEGNKYVIDSTFNVNPTLVRTNRSEASTYHIQAKFVTLKYLIESNGNEKYFYSIYIKNGEVIVEDKELLVTSGKGKINFEVKLAPGTYSFIITQKEYEVCRKDFKI